MKRAVMKRAVIVRHAKSVPYGYEDDFNRDLKDRGKNDAGHISKELEKRGVFPDIMVSSPAKRAIKTARIFADNLEFNKKNIREEKAIYEGQSTYEFLEMIQSLPEGTVTAFFFGHNPGIHYFVNNLLGDFNGDMPTCSTVVIDFKANTWKEVEARTGKMAFQLVPIMFK